MAYENSAGINPDEFDALEKLDRSGQPFSGTIGADGKAIINKIKPTFSAAQYDWDGARKAGVSDGGILDFLHSSGALGGYDLTGARKAGVPDDEIANFLKPKPPAPAPTSPERTWSDFATDTAKDFTIGVGQLAGAAGWLARKGIVDPIGRMAEGKNYRSNTDFEDATTGTVQNIQESQSAKSKYQQGELAKHNDDDGIISGFVDSLAFLAKNPTAAFSLGVQSLPGTLLAGGIGGRVATGIAERAGAEALKAGLTGEAAIAAKELAVQAAERGAGWAAGSAEAIQSLGQIGQQIEQKLDEKGITDPQLRHNAMMQAIPAALGTLLAGRFIGAGAESRMFAGKALTHEGESFARAVLKTGAKESMEEIGQSVPEQFFQNLGEQEGGIDTALTKGIGASAAQGGVVGFAQGAGSGGIGHRPSTSAAKAIQDAPDVDTAIKAATQSNTDASQSLADAISIPAATPAPRGSFSAMDEFATLASAEKADLVLRKAAQEKAAVQDSPLSMNSGQDEIVNAPNSGIENASAGAPSQPITPGEPQAAWTSVEEARLNLVGTQMDNLGRMSAANPENKALEAKFIAAADEHFDLLAKKNGVISADGQPARISSGLDASADARSAAIAGATSEPASNQGARSVQAQANDAGVPAKTTGQVNGQVPTQPTNGSSGRPATVTPEATGSVDAGRPIGNEANNAVGNGTDPADVQANRAPDGGRQLPDSTRPIGASAQAAGEVNEQLKQSVRASTAAITSEPAPLRVTPTAPGGRGNNEGRVGAPVAEGRDPAPIATPKSDYTTPKGEVNGNDSVRGYKQGLPTAPSSAASVRTPEARGEQETVRGDKARPGDDSASPDNRGQNSSVDYTTSKGEVKTFKKQGAATLYAKGNKLKGYVPRETSDGWVLSKTIKPKSPAQLKAQAKREKDAITPYPDRDHLHTAIAKLGGLDRKEAVATWGSDPKDKRPSGVFRKPTLRYGGLSIDAMGEKLAELGYLPVDENGKYDVRDFEEAFKKGQDYYTPQAIERRAALSQEQRDQEEDARYQESAADIVEETPEADNLDANQINVALDVAEDLAQDISWIGVEAKQDEIANMRAMGFTEEEIADEVRNQEIRQSPPGETASGQETASTESSNRNGEEDQAEPASGEVDPATNRPPASWVIRNKETGEVQFETFDRAKVDALNTDKYEAVPIGGYLGEVSAKAAEPVNKNDDTDTRPPEPVKGTPEIEQQAPQTSGVSNLGMEPFTLDAGFLGEKTYTPFAPPKGGKVLDSQYLIGQINISKSDLKRLAKDFPQVEKIDGAQALRVSIIDGEYGRSAVIEWAGERERNNEVNFYEIPSDLWSLPALRKASKLAESMFEANITGGDNKSSKNPQQNKAVEANDNSLSSAADNKPTTASILREAADKIDAPAVTIKDVPKSKLKQIKVQMPQIKADGSTVNVEMSATDALADLSAQEKAYKALRACVG